VFVSDLSMSGHSGGIEAFALGWIEDGLARGFRSRRFKLP
jgi:hypothetical protein